MQDLWNRDSCEVRRMNRWNHLAEVCMMLSAALCYFVFRFMI